MLIETRLNFFCQPSSRLLKIPSSLNSIKLPVARLHPQFVYLEIINLSSSPTLPKRCWVEFIVEINISLIQISIYLHSSYSWHFVFKFISSPVSESCASSGISQSFCPPYSVLPFGQSSMFNYMGRVQRCRLWPRFRVSKSKSLNLPPN